MDKKDRFNVKNNDVNDGIPTSKAANFIIAQLDHLDQKVTGFMSSYAILIIRVSLGIVFLWFGLLKVIGLSPVFDLASQVVYWLPSELFVPILGFWEMAIGAGLLLGKALRIILSLLFIQLAGTFLVLVIRPDAAFQDGNPLLLTTEGEFVIKNLVLIAAGLAVGGTVRHGWKEERRKRQQMTGGNEQTSSSPEA